MKRFLSHLLFCVFVSATAQNDIVVPDAVTIAIHQNNIGRIVFTNRNVPLDELKHGDFLETYDLNRQSNLNIRVFLDNSITNYMHRLSPGLSADELNAKGNFRFTFIVDQKEIYSENIHYGCGLRKSETTTFRVPFTDTSGADWWSVHLWDRFKENGGRNALTEGSHQLLVEIRPYVKTDGNEALIGPCIAKGELHLTIPKNTIPEQQIAIQPIRPGSGFSTSNAPVDTHMIRKLNEKIADETFKYITSVVVLNDGKLQLEEYFNGADRNSFHDTRSVGKSFTSALMGIAIEKGYIGNENQAISTFYPLRDFENYSEAKAQVTIKDLLTMSSCFDGSDQVEASPGNEENMYPAENWVRFALNLPVDTHKTSGRQWDYFTAGVVILGDILNKNVPGGLEKFANDELFSPLGITKYQWQYTPQKVVNTAGGLQMSALDFARFGQLYKNNGKWNGRQLLPSAWVQKTFTKQLPLPARPNEYYGFLFWNKVFTINGKQYETYYCAGNGGNKIFIFKDLPVTVVVTAKAYNRSYAHSQVDKMMEQFILPAVIK